MYLYSVKDVKSGIYAAPFVSENEQTAARALQTTLFTSTDSLLKMYPEDYILYQIGEFNNETGSVYEMNNLRIANCCELIDSYRKDDVDPDKVVKIDKKSNKSKK